MPATVIHLRDAEDLRDVVHRAVQALVEGKLVAFPTETVYGLAASALHAKAVERLIDVKGRQANHPLALAVKSADEAADFVPSIPPLAKRLARRCWPGPVTLVLAHRDEESLLRQLPRSVQSAVSPNGTIGLRVPAHPMILDVLRLLAGPLVLSSANRTGQPDSVTAEEVVAVLGEDVQLVLDDGRCQFGQPSSVVKVTERGWEMLRTGVVSPAALRRLASYSVLLVCTGNTCRSPMAEQLLRKQLADALSCQPDQLEDQGVMVQSAGVSASPGCRATPEAATIMRSRGLDLSRHLSQPLSDRAAQGADLILTMTRAHRDMVVSRWPEAASRTDVLSLDQSDVADPIGGTTEDYRQCAEQIDAALAERFSRLDIRQLAQGAGGPS